ncbi:hypothetical protein BDV96DRAFT_495626, partial [Lophiotrema nucula]
VLEGSVHITLGNKCLFLTPEEGEVCILPFTRNNLIPGPLSDTQRTTKVLLSAPKAEGDRMLDFLSYENYYRYLDQAISCNEGIDILQILCMFDAGGSCIALPRFILFNMALSMVIGVVLGRWVGRLLGYQPYYKEWSTDWDTARQRMAKCIFQRRFATT